MVVVEIRLRNGNLCGAYLAIFRRLGVGRNVAVRNVRSGHSVHKRTKAVTRCPRMTYVDGFIRRRTTAIVVCAVKHRHREVRRREVRIVIFVTANITAAAGIIVLALGRAAAEGRPADV